MKLKVLQWNVWMRESPKKVAQTIKEIDPDVVCCQEIFQNLNTGTDSGKEILDGVNGGYESFYKEAVTWDNRPEITSQGNAIYSKFPILSTDFSFVTPFKHNPPNATKEGRVYLEIQINVGGRIINIGTVHMSYSYAMRNVPRRKKEADNLASLLKDKVKNFILTGDLNSVPGTYVFNKVLENPSLVNAAPDFSEKTWTTKPFDYHGFKTDRLDYRIDYIFATKDLRVESTKIIKTEASDHLPILTVFDIT